MLTTHTIICNEVNSTFYAFTLGENFFLNSQSSRSSSNAQKMALIFIIDATNPFKVIHNRFTQCHQTECVYTNQNKLQRMNAKRFFPIFKGNQINKAKNVNWLSGNLSSSKSYNITITENQKHEKEITAVRLHFSDMATDEHSSI